MRKQGQWAPTILFLHWKRCAPGKDLGHPLSAEESGRPLGSTGRWPLVIERRLNLESNAQDEYSPLSGHMTFGWLAARLGHMEVEIYGPKGPLILKTLTGI